MGSYLNVCLAAAAFIGIVAPRNASAQALSGTLVDESTQHAVAGAQATLLTASQVRVAFAFSDSAGHFTLRAPTAGSYRLRIVGLGYSPLEIPVDLDAGPTMVRRFQVNTQPIELGAIRANGPHPCGTKRGRPEVAMLWEDIRMALETVVLGAELPKINYTAIEYTRNLDRWKKVHAVDSVVVALVGEHGPYLSAPADSLLQLGFVQPDPTTGAFAYFGPDAEVLLSNQFLNAYCFEQEESGKRPGEIGLRFRPMNSSGVSGIKGTIWANQKSRELISIEFKFEDLPIADPQIDAGGEVKFSRLPNGPWIVTNWVLTVPRFVEQPRGDGGRDLIFGTYRQLERVVIEGRYMDGRLAYHRTSQ